MLYNFEPYTNPNLTSKAFYRKRKIDHYEDLCEAQKIRVQIRADCNQMVD